MTFAVALAKSGGDFDVDIYESTGSFSEIGAGMNLWPRVEKTLKILGLREDLKSRRTLFSDDRKKPIINYISREFHRDSFHLPAIGGKMAYYKADQAELIECGRTDRKSLSF